METGDRPQSSDAERTAKAGRQSLFLDALARRYRTALNRFFERRAPSFRHDSEDLTQEVFVRLARRGGEHEIEQVEQYLFQTARSVLMDHHRRRTTRHQNEHEPYEDEAHAVEDFSPERVLLGRDQVETVRRALADMPERVRGAFVLHRFEDLTYAEIAARLGVSVSSVEKYIIRALRDITEWTKGEL